MNETLDASAMNVVRSVLANNSGGRVALSAIHEDLRIAQDLGIDSLKFILVILELEEALGRKIFDVDNVKNIATAGDLYHLVKTTPTQDAPRNN